ncbi:MAG: hypothetical protein LUO93_05595, partial [Methanomicrobiales archaeon]|nr:hypothetical protein [Methanomicrobiales archaeon]
ISGLSLAAPHVAVVTLSGNSINLNVDSGQHVLNVTAAEYATNTHFGIGAYGAAGGTVARFDDFSVESLT